VQPQWRQADAAIAGDDAGDTLAEFGCHRWVGQQQPVIVRVHVDEPGRQREAVQVDHLLRVRAIEWTHGHDAIRIKGYIGKPSRRTRTVEHERSAQQHIMVRHPGITPYGPSE
jgi:hypothetical protein